MRAIITADWHLRRDRPRCRLDEDWIETQRKVLDCIIAQATKKECSVYIIGDIFNTPQQSAEIVILVISVIRHIKHPFILAGNHDLPYHSYDYIDNCSYGILKRYCPEIPILGSFIGTTENNNDPDPQKQEILFIHKLVFPSEKEMPPNTDAITADQLLDEYPNTKWIFTGDNHHSFHYHRDGRHVVNPGCITRQAADLIDYAPKIYYIDEDEVIEIPLPDTGVMVTDEYLRREDERNDRIEAFVETVKSQGKVSLDFRANLDAKLKAPDVWDGVKNIVWEILEEIVC